MKNRVIRGISAYLLIMLLGSGLFALMASIVSYNLGGLING